MIYLMLALYFSWLAFCIYMEHLTLDTRQRVAYHNEYTVELMQAYGDVEPSVEVILTSERMFVESRGW